MTESHLPPLKFLHDAGTLVASKLKQFEGLSTDVIVDSLLPGRGDCLKTRDDGTIIDGHHRIHVLRGRGVDVDALPREIVARTDFS